MMSTDKIDLDERLYYLQSSTGQIWGRSAFRKRFWSRNSMGFDTSREPPNRFGHCLRLSRDKRTLRAMKRPAGPAGTREAYKRVYPLVEQVTSMVLHGAATFLIDPYAVEREATLRRSSQGAKRAHLQRVRRMLRGWGWNVKRARVRGNLSAWHWSHWDGIAWGNSRVS